MKYFVMLIYLFIPTIGLAVNCSEMKEDLLAIEDRLQNTCIAQEAGDGSCCDPCPNGDCTNVDIMNVDLNCIKKKDLEGIYNIKMAELVVLEGLSVLRMSVQGDYNALNDVTEDQLDEADQYIKRLERSADEVELFYEAFGDQKPSSKNYVPTIFADHNGYEGTLDEYITAKCADPKFLGTRFCSKIESYKNSSKAKHALFLEKLQGFLGADRTIGNDDQKRFERYNTYKDFLTFTITEGDSSTKRSIPGNLLKTDPSFKKISKIKKLITNYKNSRTSNNADNLLNALNSMTDLSTEGKGLGNVSNYNQTAITSLKTDASLPKQMMDFPSLLLEGKFNKQYRSTLIRLNVDLENQASGLLASANKLDMDCSTLSCIERTCDPNNSNNKHLKFCTSEYEFYKKQKASRDDLKRVKNCFNLKLSKNEMRKDLDQRKIECIGKEAPKDSDLAKLRNELRDIKNQIHQQDDNLNIKLLNIHKAMGLKALEGPCSYKVKSNQIDCRGTGDLVGKNYQFTELTLDSQKINFAYNNQLLKDTMAELGVDKKLETYREDFIKKCKGTDTEEAIFEDDSLCQYWMDDYLLESKVKKQIAKTKKDQKIRRATNRRNAQKRRERREKASQDKINSALINAGMFVAYNGANAILQTKNMELGTDYKIQGIQQCDVTFQPYCMQYMPSTGYYYPSNWGYQYAGTNIRDVSTFNLNNQQSIFRDPTNPIQYSMGFVPPPSTTEVQAHYKIDLNNWQIKKVTYKKAPLFSFDR